MRTAILMLLLILVAACSRMDSAGLPATTGANPAGTGTTLVNASGSNPSPYTVFGIPVYTPCDWYTTPLNVTPSCSTYAVSSVDPNSTNIINNMIAANGGSMNITLNAGDKSVSLNASPANHDISSNMTFYQTTGFRMVDDSPYNDDTSRTMPWESAFLRQGGCSWQDCHAIVVATDTHLEYETYICCTNANPIVNGTFTAEAGFVHNLDHSLNSQLNGFGIITKSGLPLLGMDDIGEDEMEPSINHIGYLVLPGSGNGPAASGGYVTPATAGATCGSYCNYRLPMGARLRLNPNRYRCPSASTNQQANRLCVQFETYGVIAADYGARRGSYGIILGPKADGSDPWDGRDICVMTTVLCGSRPIPLSAWDVMTLGTIR